MGRRAKPVNGKAEAKRPLARKSSKDQGAKVRDLEKSLAESLERETATGGILRVISQSPTEMQPVFDAIVRSGAALCHAPDAVISIADGDTLRLVASVGSVAASVGQSQLLQGGRMPLTRGSVSGRAIIDRRTVHVHDVNARPDDEFPEGKVLQREYGGRGTTLAVPLLREDVALGAITLLRDEVSPFTDRQVALLETFADQAVMAIENVRLFNETKEALERETATSEILQVISSSPTDTQPVFDAIVQSAVTLCGAILGAIYRREGDLVHVVGLDRRYPEAAEMRAVYPAPVTSALMSCRAIHENAIIHLPDTETAGVLPPEGLRLARLSGFRSVVAVPMRREGDPIGAILVGRPAVGPFPDEQIALLQTFADQAVIAIENARLLSELQQRNEALAEAHAQVTEALDQQTATGEILSVISRAQTDAQPVFEIIAASARRLCGAAYAQVQLCDDEQIRLAALDSANPEGDAAIRAVYPLRVGDGSAGGRAIATRTVAQIPDLLDDQAYRFTRVWETSGLRSLLAVPMLRDGEPIGTIGIGRVEPGAFPQAQIDLLQTFADQAVIAVENVRLFRELEARTQDLTQSVNELMALGEVSLALSSTLNLETVLQTIVLRANELARTAGCTIWEYDEAREEFRLRASDYSDENDAAALQGVDRMTTIAKGVGVTTHVFERRQPVQIHDIVIEGAEENPLRRRLVEAGHRALLGVPLLSEGEVVGVLVVTRKTAGQFEPQIVRLLGTFATQAALAIQNAQLFREIEDKSRQLERASQHKSEFLANMSHELRTPMNAIIGFSEVLTERMFGELNEKQDEYLRDIYASGQHLLSLINDILDLSKIEAGRMELEPTDFDLPAAIDNALTLVRERAGRREIALGRVIDERVGAIHADERKVKQVLLNLLSNALKFTPEGGRIDVRAAVNDGMVEVSVADTGVGIAPEDQETVFEEFRQVGTADKKVEGTGLGLALSRKFIELHGGRIGVKSQVGEGSTFTFTLPVRRSE